jgi:hypothetical protein
LGRPGRLAVPKVTALVVAVAVTAVAVTAAAAVVASLLNSITLAAAGKSSNCKK